MRSARILLEHIIDYAGLFPPAQLDMISSVKNFAVYRREETAWMLGRFILPTSRFDEFEEVAGVLLPHAPVNSAWLLSALGGDDLESDLAKIRIFNQRHAHAHPHGAALIDTLELKASDPATIARLAEIDLDRLLVYVELPIDNDPSELIAALSRVGARAKVRTGGIRHELFPSSTDLLQFIQTCIKAKVPFKATAGLHHPICATYPLTYEPNSPTGLMYGFLNVFLCAALLYSGAPAEQARKLLEETATDAFRFDDAGVTWRDQQLSNDTLARVRQGCAVSFGSCSFHEPIDDLKAIGVF